MSANLEMLWSKVKDLKHDAQRFTDNKAIHGLINDLIDEIEIEMSEDEAEYDPYDDEDNNIVDFMMADD
jgi:hypothetical protein